MKPKIKPVASLSVIKRQLKKIKIYKIKAFLGKLPLILARHPFLTCLFLFILSLIIGGLLFYKYIILAQKIKPELLEISVLKENDYREVLEVWQRQEKKFNEADLKEYPDSFEITTPSPGESAPGESEEKAPEESESEE